ncbi:hypothetical protein [Vulcanisaeta distributa]|nr:hypothetical protein [Vulcanisaeta distributa]
MPNRPGLGVDVNEKVLTEMRFEGMEPFHEEEPVWVIKYMEEVQVIPSY